MRILLDECVNPRLREAFPGHDIWTVTQLGWRSVSDSSLLTLSDGRFEAFVTLDRGFEFEHKLSRLSFGIVIVHVARNSISHYRPLYPNLVLAIDAIKPGQVIHVGR